MGLDRIPIESKIIRALSWTLPGAEILSVQGSRIPGAAVPDEIPADEDTLEAPAAVTPTEEATKTATEKPVPGFEAIFAIAGLLAIAYLVLRQRDWAHELCEGRESPFQFSFFQKYEEENNVYKSLIPKEDQTTYKIKRPGDIDAHCSKLTIRIQDGIFQYLQNNAEKWHN